MKEKAKQLETKIEFLIKNISLSEKLIKKIIFSLEGLNEEYENTLEFMESKNMRVRILEFKKNSILVHSEITRYNNILEDIKKVKNNVKI